VSGGGESRGQRRETRAAEEIVACGIISGIFEVLKGATREPVGKKHFRFYKQLKTCGPTLMEK
jgi:hypothetical protein